jgi:TPR repeat protein
MEIFLRSYPDGLFADVARESAQSLEQEGTDGPLSADEVFWRTIKGSILPADFELYLSIFDTGAYRDLAQARIESLRRAASIQGYVMEDGQRLSSREGIRQAVLAKSDQLPLTFVQYGLIALGYPIADPAGILDGPTRRATRAYQASIGSPQTGVLTSREILDVVLTAAAIGDQHAETAVGVMTASGIGLEQDDQVARLWLSRAADQGNGYAQANLAVLYRDGRGGDKDIDKARSLLQAAVAQGVGEAEPMLRALGG